MILGNLIPKQLASVWYHDVCVHHDPSWSLSSGKQHAIMQEKFLKVACIVSLLYNNLKCKYSHKSVVDESPFPRSLQHVVEVILEAPVPRVPAAALRAVGQRLPQQAEPGTLLPLRSHRTCRGGRQETVTDSYRVVHRPPPRLHIFQWVVLRPASCWALQPEPGAAALVAGVTSRHGITSAVRWETGRHSHVAKCSGAGCLTTLTFTVH